LHGDIPMEHLRGITTDAARAVNSFHFLCSTNWRTHFAMPPLYVIEASQLWSRGAFGCHWQAGGCRAWRDYIRTLCLIDNA
jgi:hypothetical protein